jgi:hypothetical protein
MSCWGEFYADFMSSLCSLPGITSPALDDRDWKKSGTCVVSRKLEHGPYSESGEEVSEDREEKKI